MPIRRVYPPRSIDFSAISSGAVDAHYRKILIRLLTVHAFAEKLTALGYEQAIAKLANPDLRQTLEKNFREEKKHARLIYRLLAQLGVNEQQADRSMITLVKAPSFEAAVHFAQHAGDELDLVMASLALDATGAIMIGVNYRESSYAPHASAAEIILEEEADHEAFATDQLGDVVRRSSSERVGAAIGEWLPRAVNFFGPPGTGFTYDCIRYGLKTHDNQELRDLYLAMIEKRCAQIGIVLPALTAEYPHALA